MAEEAAASIQVAVRVRPLNERERDEGFRNCISFDDATKQVVLSAVDRATLMQLRGSAAKGYAFDRFYGAERTSDAIYDDCVRHLVDSLFMGYNATVLAYGQTGSGKTLTMSGGMGTYGQPEKGIIRRAAEHILAHVDVLRERLKPGEAVSVRAYGLELYNEELRDLGSNTAAAAAAAAGGGSGQDSGGGGGGGGSGSSEAVRISERPCGNGRCTPEVVGVTTVEVHDAEALLRFFADCYDNRAVAATRMNDRSSRSHAVYTILVSRTLVDVSEGGGRVRTSVVESRFNLVDLAGSERVKRSGVTGAAFKEAVHINGGLLALGNVIVALSGGDEPQGDGASPSPADGAAAARPPSPVKAAKHVPYRDSKLTRLLQDSLGGNALTVLISCVSSCEADFEETNSTLKYANRACRIKNQPLANKQLLLEEDLLPLLPAGSAGSGAGGMSVTQMQLLLADHARMKEARERREAERREKEEKRLTELRSLKEAERKAPGFQRLRAQQYDDLRKRLISSQGSKALKGEGIVDETLAGFRSFEPFHEGASSGGGSDRDSPEWCTDVSSPRGSGSGSGSRPRTASPAPAGSNRLRSSSTPARPGTARTGSSTPRVASATTGSAEATTQHQPAPAPAPPPAHGRLSAPQILCVDSAVGPDGDETDSSSSEQALVQAGDSGAVSSSSKAAGVAKGKLAAAVADEATCTSPTAIKACYAPQQAGEAFDAAAAAAAGDDSSGGGASTTTSSSGGGASLSSSSAAAYEVLEFKQAQPEPPPCEERDPDSKAPDAPQPVPPPPPQLLARFRVNTQDTLAVFRAVSGEDFADVASLLPANSALPAADRMTYLLARLESQPRSAAQLSSALDAVAAGMASMGAAVGPAVGCLMATFGTNLISSCIMDFDDPEQLQGVGAGERLELWGLQIPHTSVRPALGSDAGSMPASSSGGGGGPCATQAAHEQQQQPPEQPAASCWSSTDRLNVSIGLMHALCNLATELGAVAGFCVPRPQLLRRWLQAGVKMRQVATPVKLIYPPSAHDFAYYKASTVAFFLVDELTSSLQQVLCRPSQS